MAVNRFYFFGSYSSSFRPFIIKVNSGSNSEFTIPTDNTTYTYNYAVTTSDSQSFTGQTGDLTITFPSANTDYIIEISGVFPYFNNLASSNPEKLIDIMQWGDIAWESMYVSFIQSTLTNVTATDAPDLSIVTDMSLMFLLNSIQTIDVSGWDVSGVTTMNSMFNITLNLTSEIDFSDAVKGSINVTDIDNILNDTSCPKLTMQAGSVTTASYSFAGATSLADLILIDMPVDFDIKDTIVTGAKLDALANSVKDMTGSPSPTITMTVTQQSSCITTLWTNKNWIINAI